MTLLSTLIAQGAETFGTLTPPSGVTAFDQQAGGGESIGLLVFFSNMIKLATVVAGLWTLLNIILAGYTYITSAGDSSAHTKVKDKVTMSVIGLVVIIAAYTIMAIIGLLFFGDATFFLNPAIQGPTP